MNTNWLDKPNKEGYWWIKISAKDKYPIVVNVYQRPDDNLVCYQCGFNTPSPLITLDDCLWQYIPYPE